MHSVVIEVDGDDGDDGRRCVGDDWPYHVAAVPHGCHVTATTTTATANSEATRGRKGFGGYRKWSNYPARFSRAPSRSLENRNRFPMAVCFFVVDVERG